MPRFFFDLQDSGSYSDEQGMELPDVAAARRMALESLPRIAADEAPAGSDRQLFNVTIRDEARMLVGSVVLTITGTWPPS